MSYSSEFKEYLKTVENKKPCCERAFEQGINLLPVESLCEKDRAAWLRGAFVACGSITDPEKQYYLSFSTSKEGLELIGSVLEYCDIAPSGGTRRGSPILYLRDSAKLEDFFAFIGAAKYSLSLMELKVIKELSADANRFRNAYCANAAKAIDAGNTQIQAINKLISQKKLHLMSPDLVETAKLRLKYPDYSLEQLRMLFSPPITKSGLNHRLKKIVDAAKENV